jgi:hypothetical protein
MEDTEVPGENYQPAASDLVTDKLYHIMIALGRYDRFNSPIYIYYTLRFYFPYLSLLAQPVTIFIYGPARYLHYFR